VVTLARARALAEAFLDTELRSRFPHEIVIVEYAIKDRGDAWVFPYNGRAYVERDDWREAMAGNVPVAVDKVTGAVGYAA
jgi:hypothetical protein